MIDEDGFIYVNGQKAGESHNWQDPASVDVKQFLHAGTNTIAVAVANWNGAGGLNKGASLQFEERRRRRWIGNAASSTASRKSSSNPPKNPAK